MTTIAYEYREGIKYTITDNVKSMKKKRQKKIKITNAQESKYANTK